MPVLRLFLLGALTAFAFQSCNRMPNNVEVALTFSGNKRSELEKVINHYDKTDNKLKLKAAYYLIANLPFQYHYVGPAVDEYRKCFGVMDSLIHVNRSIDYDKVFDSIEQQINPTVRRQMVRKADIEVIDADFLINNIEEAFKVWEFPWARLLTFDEFCKYILPYKLKNETPELWRSAFWEKYKWIADSVKGNDPEKVLLLINHDLAKWFYVSRTDVPFDLSASDLLKIRSGKCPQEVQLATYAMRAMGLPVAMDGLPYWGNRNKGHDWNAYVTKKGSVPFLGSEVDPGGYKLEFPWPASIASRRPKVWRWSYDRQAHPLSDIVQQEDIPDFFRNERMADVTTEYLPTTSVRVPIGNNEDDKKVAFLCVFNNLDWKPVQWGNVNNNSAVFRNIGRGIVYMPSLYDEGEMASTGNPFLLTGKGEMHVFDPRYDKLDTLIIDRKYPSGADNEIVVGLKYRLLYWDNGWKNAGEKIADSKTLVFYPLPRNTLFWLRCLDEGAQERIFDIKNHAPQWW